MEDQQAFCSSRHFENTCCLIREVDKIPSDASLRQVQGVFSIATSRGRSNGNKANLPSIFFSLFLLYEGLRVDLLESSVWWTDFIALLHTHRRLINLTSVISLISHAPKSSMMVALPRKCWRSHSYCWSTHWSYVKLLSRKAARKWMLQVWDNIK